MMKTRLTGFAATAVAAALALTAAPALAEEQATAAVGEPAPQFELTDIEGNTHKLSNYEGQIVVLHFQSPSCPWEQNYQPYLTEWANQLTAHTDDEGKARVVFLGINPNDRESVDSLKSYHEERQMPYTILKDNEHKVADLYDARTTPHIYVIDETQTLRYMGGVEQVPPTLGDVGKMEEQYLVPAVEALLNGEEPPHTETKSKGCGIQRSAA